MAEIISLEPVTTPCQSDGSVSLTTRAKLGPLTLGMINMSVTRFKNKPTIDLRTSLDSLIRVRLSEWPRMTHGTSRFTNISALRQSAGNIGDRVTQHVIG